jgi:hypothetical protein
MSGAAEVVSREGPYKPDWDGLRCPECNARTITDGINRWCSYTSCDWGLSTSVPSEGVWR